MAARNGDAVFLNLDYLPNFTRQFTLGIRKRFILVCQNSDQEFNARHLHTLRPYALHIYTINCVIQDPMVTTLPIAFGDWSLSVIPAISQDPCERTIPIFAAFLVSTNPGARQPCKDAMQKDPRARVTHVDRTEYYETLKTSQYVVCPEGTGHDTHRIYESLYFGAIPIVLSPNPLDHLYEGWPLKRVTSWENMELNYEEDKLNLDLWLTQNPRWFETRLPL